MKTIRAETRDASHENCFHQLEGIVIDKNITVKNLIYFMETMLAEIFYNPLADVISLLPEGTKFNSETHVCVILV